MTIGVSACSGKANTGSSIMNRDSLTREFCSQSKAVLVECSWSMGMEVLERHSYTKSSVASFVVTVLSSFALHLLALPLYYFLEDVQRTPCSRSLSIHYHRCRFAAYQKIACELTWCEQWNALYGMKSFLSTNMLSRLWIIRSVISETTINLLVGSRCWWVETSSKHSWSFPRVRLNRF